MPSIMERYEQGGEGGGYGERAKDISWADFNANPIEGASDLVNGVKSIYQGGQWVPLGPEGESDWVDKAAGAGITATTAALFGAGAFGSAGLGPLAASGFGGAAGVGAEAAETAATFGSLDADALASSVLGDAGVTAGAGALAPGINWANTLADAGTTLSDAGPGMSFMGPNGLVPLSADTAAALGIEFSTPASVSGFDFAAPQFGVDSYLTEAGGAEGSLFGTGVSAGEAAAGGAAGSGLFDDATAWLKKLGLSPASAAMLGLSGAQSLTTPKLPEAAQKLNATAGPGAASASAAIESGGTSTPAWATQKASIDATIDQQIKEQSQAMLQQAVNSGQGADSQVTLQQINKLKDQLETQRQNLYAQAQANNVKTALTELGISDTALASVASTQFTESKEAKSAAADTAKNAMLLQALSKQAA